MAARITAALTAKIHAAAQVASVHMVAALYGVNADDVRRALESKPVRGLSIGTD